MGNHGFFWFLFSCTGTLKSQSQWFFSSTGSAAHSMCSSVSQKAADKGRLLPTIANGPGTKTRNTEAHWQPQHWPVANHPVKTFPLQAFCLPQSPQAITVTKKNLKQQLHSCQIRVLWGLMHDSLMMYETFLYCHGNDVNERNLPLNCRAKPLCHFSVDLSFLFY